MSKMPAQIEEGAKDLTQVLPSGMTPEEVNFLYNVEILDLPARKAASMAGMPLSRICAPHIIQARELVKREVRGMMAVTKEDVVFGMQEAIHRAKMFGEPMTEIVGWEKIAKILGHDAPRKIDLNISASVEVLKDNVKSMTDEELVRQLGAGDIIDAEFYDAPR